MPLSQPPLSPPAGDENRRRYWRSTQRLIVVLLLLWFSVSFGGLYFARELSFSFFGWPFSFWVAAQGALIVYCLIIWFHAWAMGRLDRRHRESDPAPEPPQAS